MGVKWFGGAARLAIVASAVACNAILGIQDLPAGSTPTTPKPFDGGASLGSCSGKVYTFQTGSLCGCTVGYFALCNKGTFSQCSCAPPSGYVPDTGMDGGILEGGGFEDAFEDIDSGFQDFNSLDDVTFDDGGFDDGAFESGFEDFDGGGFDDALVDDGGLDGSTGGGCSALSACCPSLPTAEQSGCAAIVGFGEDTTCGDELLAYQAGGYCLSGGDQ